KETSIIEQDFFLLFFFSPSSVSGIIKEKEVFCMFDSTKVWDSFLSQGGLIIIFIAIMILCLLFMTLIFCILGITNGVLKKTRSRIICGILGLLCLVIGFVDLVVVFKLAL